MAVESDDSAAVAGVVAVAAVAVAALPSPSPALAASFVHLGPYNSVS